MRYEYNIQQHIRWLIHVQLSLMQQHLITILYDGENEVKQTEKKKVMVLGSGPIRIGQGIEFDFCSVHCMGIKQRRI